VDPSPNLPPIKPLFEGTETIDMGGARFSYTIGRDHVKDPLREILMSREPIAVDIETFGLGASALNIKSVAFATCTRAVICDPRDPFQRDLVQRSLAYALELLFWNSAFDVPNLARNGLLGEAECTKVTDGMLYARLAEPDERVRKTLTAAWERYLGSGDTGQAVDENKSMFRTMGAPNKTEGFRLADLHMPMYVHGAALDVIRTARLMPAVRQAAYRQLTEGHPYQDEGVQGEEAWALTDREQRINRLMLRRSVRGLRVDFEYLDQYRDANAAVISETTQALERAGVRVTNANTLFEVLEREGAIPPNHPRTPTGKYSATATVLQGMDHPLARAFVARKKLVKNDEDYLAKVVELASSAGRIHPSVNLLGASATGRTSYGTPPLQQFPEPARGIILADEGDELTSIDFSQIEPLIAANLAGEEEIVARFEDPTVKADLYTPVAEKAGIARKQAKTVLLGLLYGLGAGKLAAQLGCSIEEAYDLRDSVFDAMPRIADWTRGLREDGERHMRVITLAGRILPVPMGTYEGRTSIQTHKAINYTVQGSAYDLLADCLVSIEEAGLGDAVYLSMHDELVVSTSAADQIRKIMEIPPERLCRFAQRVPVLRTDRLDLGERWAVA
jgi:DNA polymerase-1